MADAALKEADAQGLTPKAAGEALRVAGDKSAQVVMGSQSNQKRGGPVSKPASGSGSARKFPERRISPLGYAREDGRPDCQDHQYHGKDR